MTWLKKYWQKRYFRMMTWFILGGGVLSIPALSLVDKFYRPMNYYAVEPYHGLNFEGFLMLWGIYFLLVLPISYLCRNVQ